MGMTIDEAKEWLISRKEHYELDDNCQELARALDIALEIMRKYQKIEQIIGEKGMPEWSYSRFMEIASIVRGYEDGKID